MAKKSTTNAKVSEPGESAVSKPVTKTKKARKPAADKAAAAPKKTKKTVLSAAPVTENAVSVTDADIALRAYYIAEKRQKLGIPGDSTSDWVEAERQLLAEAAAKP